jgi:hypothetical protein
LTSELEKAKPAIRAKLTTGETRQIRKILRDALIERELVKWSREKISRCFYSFLRKLIFIRKDAKAEGEQREVSRLLEPKGGTK